MYKTHLSSNYYLSHGNIECSKLANVGKLAIFPELEEELTKWICEKRNSVISIVKTAIHLKEKLIGRNLA